MLLLGPFPRVFVYTVCLLAAARTSSGDSCSIDGAPGRVPCKPTDTLTFDNNIKLHGEEAGGESIFTGLYNTIADKLSVITNGFLEDDTPKESRTEIDWEKEYEGIDFDSLLSEASKLAETMAQQQMGFSASDLDSVSTFSKSESEADVGVETSDYEYQPVVRRESPAVGEETWADIGDSEPVKLITRALDPPLYEIPNFLSDKDCDYIISRASEKGMQMSRLFLNKNTVETDGNVHSSRRSESQALEASDLDSKFLERHLSRVARLAGVPVDVVRWSEELAIGKYEVGGHYHAHLDSTDLNPAKPCCFQKSCTKEKGLKDVINTDCCRLCRYATVLFYLNDVEEGGETAFPVADLTYSQMREKMEDKEWSNLTENCYDSQVYVKPEKGKAILWYNHFTDKQGYLGGLSKRSYHGGCDVRKGAKWIATNWISMPTYKHRYLRSKHRLDDDEE